MDDWESELYQVCNFDLIMLLYFILKLLNCVQSFRESMYLIFTMEIGKRPLAIKDNEDLQK